MIILLEKKEVEEILEMRAKGKKKTTILQHLMMNAKLDYRYAENIDLTQLPTFDFSSLVKK